MSVLIDVSRRAECIRVERIQNLIEQLAKRLQLRWRETIRRRECVDVDEDVRADIAQARADRRETHRVL